MTIHLRSALLSLLMWATFGRAAMAATHESGINDPLEPARAALRTLQFDTAIAELNIASRGGNKDAEYLLGLIYLNGVGIKPDPERGRALMTLAAEHGHAAAAYVLAGELARDANALPGASRTWLERSAAGGYSRARDALKSGRPLLDSESVGKSDPSLLTAWVFDCVHADNVAELRRLGSASTSVRDAFGRTALSHAAELGRVAVANLLLDLGSDVNAVDEVGVTALMIAAERADQSMLALLLKRGADIQAQDGEKRSALFYAARANRGDNLKLLEADGARLDMTDSRGCNALDAALSVDAEASVNELTNSGLHANRIAPDAGRASGKFDVSHPGEIYRGWTALALAAVRDDAASALQLIESGTDVNIRLPGGDTPIQVAADAHALHVVELLLAHHANALAHESSGHSALWLAANRNDLPLIKVLLEGGVSPDAHTPDESPPLLAALRAHRTDAAELLLSAGASVESTDARARTALMVAAAADDVGLVKELIQRRAHVDSVDTAHRTALHYAVAAGSRGAVDVLLAAGADPNKADASGMSSLHTAAAQADAGVLGPLLSLKISINSRNSSGDTPLMIAAAGGHLDLVKTLLEHKPELDIQNRAGDTALIAASRGGHAAVCHLLATAGANKLLRNNAGVSAADVAAGRGFSEVANDLGRKRG